jgi:hypothetical protein
MTSANAFGHSGTARISRVEITPVAFADPPLLNAVGVHEPYALRAILQVFTDAGLVGLGETYADDAHLDRLAAVAAALPGYDAFDTGRIRALVDDLLSRESGSGGDGVAGMITGASDTAVPSSTCSEAGCVTGFRTAPTSFTNGRDIPGRMTMNGAKRSRPTSWLTRPAR